MAAKVQAVAIVARVAAREALVAEVTVRELEARGEAQTEAAMVALEVGEEVVAIEAVKMVAETTGGATVQVAEEAPVERLGTVSRAAMTEVGAIAEMAVVVWTVAARHSTRGSPDSWCTDCT